MLPTLRATALRHLCFPSNVFYNFFGVPHLATCIFLFSNEPELGEGIDPSMALNPFPSNNLDETSFEPTTFRS